MTDSAVQSPRFEAVSPYARWPGIAWPGRMVQRCSIHPAGVGMMLAAGALVALGFVILPAWLWLEILLGALGVLGLGVALRLWQRLCREQKALKLLSALLAEVRAGEAPIDELSHIKGSLAPVVAGIQEILRDLRQQRAELAVLEHETRQRVAQRTDALERMIGSLRQQANRDPLTGLYNRRMLNKHLATVIEQAREAGSDLGLLMLDLDNFKILNDTLGHAAGDEVLRTLGQIIRSSIREQDLAFRCGGDEFVIVLPDCSSAGTHGLAQRLVALIDALGRTLKTSRALGVSVGAINLSEMSDEDVKTLLVEADKRLYSVKAERKEMSRSLGQG